MRKNSSVMERLLPVKDKEEEIKDNFREERVESIWVDSEVAVVFVEPTTELVAVVVTLVEMEVGIKLLSVGEGGGSFNIGTNQLNECCYNYDKHDKVIITFLQ